MNVLAAAFVTLVSSCLFAPVAAVHRASGPAGGPQEYFPVPPKGISIQVGAEKLPRLSDLLTEFSHTTGMTIVSDEPTRRMLEVGCGLNQSVDVPPAQVYAFVESVLAYHGFVLYHLRSEAPRLLGVIHPRAMNESAATIKPVYVPVEELAVWKDHPAFLVQTMLTLSNVDVRMLSNAMRQQLTDARTQQLIPLGNSNSLQITAPAGALTNLVTMLQRCDEEAARQPSSEPAPQKPAESGKPGK